MKKYLNIELIMTLVILAFIGMLAVQGQVDGLSANAMRFPSFVFTVGGILGVVEIIRNVSAVRAVEKKGEAAKKKPLFKNKKNLAEFIVLTLAYLVLLYLTGFTIASIIMVIAYGILRGFEKKWIVVVAGIAVILVWYVLFAKVIGVKMLGGVLIKGLV